MMDAAPHCPDRFGSPVIDITRRESRLFTRILVAAFLFCVGFLGGVGYALFAIGARP